ncbi:MAG: fibronectin type III domain-containing protein [Deltaproteobacteria bacterium]|nr:fibronectin type III domain-containing protein [Deltaproteobacteria bacterium]MBW2396563.1 fibronectin type III domain-containing protein [Deltaproteobacteria bacterium]
MSRVAQSFPARKRRQRLRWRVFGFGLTLGASGALAGELEIEWRAPDEPVLGFVIERRLGQETSPALIARVGPEARKFIDDDVVPGAAACYRVRAILGDGSWAPSLERCAMPTLTASPPEEVRSVLPPVSAEPPEAESKRVSDRFEPVPSKLFAPAEKAPIREALEEAPEH